MTGPVEVRGLVRLLAAHPILPPADGLPPNDKALHVLLADLARGDRSSHAGTLREVAAERSVPVEEITRRAQFLLACLVVPASGTHYEVLGVSRNASTGEIRRRWGSLMQLYHPDRLGGGGGWLDEHARRLIEAYRTLKDPERRRQYDAQLAGGRVATWPQAGGAGCRVRRLWLPAPVRRWASAAMLTGALGVLIWGYLLHAPAPLPKAALPANPNLLTNWGAGKTTRNGDRAVSGSGGQQPAPAPEAQVATAPVPAPMPAARERSASVLEPQPAAERPAGPTPERIRPQLSAPRPDAAPRQAEAPAAAAPPPAAAPGPSAPADRSGGRPAVAASPSAPSPAPSQPDVPRPPPRPATPSPAAPPASSTLAGSSTSAATAVPPPGAPSSVPAETLAARPPSPIASRLSPHEPATPPASPSSPPAAPHEPSPGAPSETPAAGPTPPIASRLTPPESAVERDEALAVLEAFRAAYERKDLDAVVGLFGSGIREREVAGRAAVHQLYVRNFAVLDNIHYELDHLEVGPPTAVGDFIVKGRFRILAMFVRSPRRPMDVGGAIRWTLRREGGALRISAIDYEVASP